MKIITKTMEIPIESNWGAPERIDDMPCDVLDIRKATPWTQAEADALAGDPGWMIEDDEGGRYVKDRYTRVLSHGIRVAQSVPTVKEMAAKDAEIAALKAEVASQKALLEERSITWK